jgi:hypothetical protein
MFLDEFRSPTAACVSVAMRLLIGIACTEGRNLLQSINGRASADGEELIECCFDL